MRCSVKEEIVELIGLNKRKFICHECNIKFTETITLHEKDHTLSNKLKIKIRKDLLNKSMTICEIARQNNVSEYTVRKKIENHNEKTLLKY